MRPSHSSLHGIGVLLACVWSAGCAAADFADYVYLPPQSPAQKAGLPARDTLLRWMSAPRGYWHTSEFAAATRAHAQNAARPGDLVAWHARALPLASEVFGPPLKEDGGFLWLGELASEQAAALRVKVALGTLGPAERLYLVEPATISVHGPFTARDGDCWLPGVTGPALILALHTRLPRLPALRMAALAHFFVPLDSKARPCPTPAACDQSPVFQEVSTAVARLLIPILGEGQFLCTGALINAPESDALEPWILTAQHCVDGPVEVEGIEAIWDYRANDCDGLDNPTLASLPRSAGTAILAENPCLDAALLALDGVPVGVFGRAWLGWDTQTPESKARVRMPHHPHGTPMKVSTGEITALDLDPCLDPECADQRFRQLRAIWEGGISEQGSSGAPALLAASNYRVVGMLSNGPLHACDTPASNFDHFASFAAFYPEIQPWLRPESGEAGPVFLCRERCPLRRIFGDTAPATEMLRDFRQRFLRDGPWEAAYYAAAPRLYRAADASFQARALIATAAFPFLFLHGIEFGSSDNLK